MTLTLTSIQRSPPGRYYRAVPVPTQGLSMSRYEVVECEPGRVDRTMCQANYRDAVQIVDALNMSIAEIITAEVTDE